jgi:nicotinamide phosphoribosyltransferase
LEAVSAKHIDGVNIESIDSILYAMQSKGYSADNIAFGSGGALLQKLDRDTQRFAFKCSAIEQDGTWHDVYKDPITDHS